LKKLTFLGKIFQIQTMADLTQPGSKKFWHGPITKLVIQWTGNPLVTLSIKKRMNSKIDEIIALLEDWELINCISNKGGINEGSIIGCCLKGHVCCIWGVVNVEWKICVRIKHLDWNYCDLKSDENAHILIVVLNNNQT